MSNPEELSCQELVELVTAYLEGALSSVDRDRFEAHLAICQGCRNYLDQMRKTIALAGRLSEEAIPAEASRQLLEVFRDWKRG